jgi:8-oxo-dGTP pyrophosphatase MutT (NUDIX family)
MQFSFFKNNIKEIKNAGLGGIEAQFILAPKYRKKIVSQRLITLDPIKAAVLVLFYPNSLGATSFVLIKRPDYEGHHANQISFPGGKKEKSDYNLKETAIRETAEELGVLINKTAIFKQLTELYIPPGNFLVQPYMACLSQRPNFVTNHEVKTILEINLSDLLDNNNITIKEVNTTSNERIMTPCFYFQNEIIWGATAMILSEIRELFISTFSN